VNFVKEVLTNSKQDGYFCINSFVMKAMVLNNIADLLEESSPLRLVELPVPEPDE